MQRLHFNRTSNAEEAASGNRRGKAQQWGEGERWISTKQGKQSKKKYFKLKKIAGLGKHWKIFHGSQSFVQLVLFLELLYETVTVFS